MRPHPRDILDLFAPDTSGASGRVRVTRVARFGSLIHQASAESGSPEDAVYLAGWMRLQHRWMGSASVAFVRQAPDAATTSSIQVDGTGPETGRDWVRLAAAAIESAGPVTPSIPDGPWSLWAGRIPIGTGAAEGMPLVLGLQGDGAAPELYADIDTSTIGPSQARVLLDCLDRAVSGLVSSPDAAGQSIDLQGTGVHAGPPLTLPPGITTVVDAFLHQVATRGSATAIAHGSANVTYADLHRRSDAAAHLLRSLGVGAGSTVGVALDRSVHAVVAILGILKAGGAYVPLDLGYPPDRVDLIASDAGVQVVIAPQVAPAGVPTRLTVVTTEQLDAAPAVEPGRHVETGEALAYVMYTSGSTGTPKGIEIPHRSILRLVIGARYVTLSPATRMLQAAPLGFDASTLELWGPLLNGGCCVIHDEALPTPRGLAHTITTQGVTTAWLTAALFNAVVDDGPDHLRGLEELLIGGEALSVAHVRQFTAARPEVVLINGYGPTECTTFTTTCRIETPLPEAIRSIPIGWPITDTTLEVLAPTGHRLPDGLIGELYVGGSGLARGYLGRPDLTAERFVTRPGASGERLYRTGDLVRVLEHGSLEFIGRADGQVKIRGFRIETGEVETALLAHDAVKACAVIADRDNAGNGRLVAYVVPSGTAPSPADLRAHLAERLPSFMVPAVFVTLDALPVTANGKLDRRRLPAPAHTRPELAQPYEAPVTAREAQLCAVLASVLGIDRVGRSDNFFDLGGNSLLVLRAVAQLRHDGADLSPSAFFRQPTPAALGQWLDDAAHASASAERRTAAIRRGRHDDPIAIIAVAGRFPGAADVDAFWRNLCDGRDSITTFGDADLDPGLPAATTADPSYVKRRGIIDGVEDFDSAFFGITPRDAELMDPQQRVFLELCWTCLERGGYAPDATTRPVGVFAGMHNASYFQHHVARHPDLAAQLGEFLVMLGNEKDYVATRVANRLNLTGPAISLNTACSTSLVAVAQAVGNLRSGLCDMALAGGVSITCPPRSGYVHQEGSMLSPDGRTRSFDASAQGTVFSDGAGVVLLKRLDDALADGDAVHAVILGAAVNNDGRDKASFTAPSVDGQAAVISAALAVAGVDARSIGYVEAHGTATPLGDPVEVEALTQAFRVQTADRGFCRIGSVKSNVGHTVIAAGAAGLIKTALALEHELLPPSLHVDAPNPKIDFAGSPFTINTAATPWRRGAAPRRAGVSSFGVGGTNAHVIVEEAPQRPASPAADGPQRLQLSARSRAALDEASSQLAAYLDAHPDVNLADVAFTLQVGRSAFAHRLAVVAASAAEAADALRSADHPRRAVRQTGAARQPLVWVFPGQGAQYARMGAGLYGHDAAFSEAFDRCLAAADDTLPFSLRERLLGGDAEALRATAVTQPALFCLEYALGWAWRMQGVESVALIGHSVGEFAAAALAGVMTVEDAAHLVARRGLLMQGMPAGTMLSVRLSADAVRAQMPAALSLAADNGPAASVVAGPADAVAAFESTLQAAGVATRRLDTSHAFHSSMMDPAAEQFEADVRRVALHAPQVPIMSTLTGRRLTDQEATDPRYWARHLRETVRFSAAVREAQAAYDPMFLEIGPRGTLSTLVRQHQHAGQTPVAIPSLADAPEHERATLALAHGHLWTIGLDAVAPAANPATGRRRVALPTYPFERRRCWLEAAAPAQHVPVTPAMPMSTATPSPAPASRLPRLVAELRTLFEDVAGVDLAATDPSTSFVELGLDSLTLTQAAMQVKRRFRVPITFRQLMEQHRSLTALSSALDAAMPADPEPAAPVAAPAAVAAQPAATAAIQTAGPAGDASLLRQVIEQQMQLMTRQLELLSGAAAAAPTASVAQATPPSQTVQLAQAPAPQVQQAGEAPPAAASEEARPVTYDVKKAFGAIARIHTQATALTDRQRVRLDAFIRRYTERTARSKAYTVAHRPHLADPRVVNGFRPMTKEITYQIVIERSKGARMWDLDGNEYVDALNGFGMSLFGWQPDFVTKAVRAQIDDGYDIGPQHPLAGDVARLVCELTGFDRAGLCNTGSEAVMAAVRIARTVTGRNLLVVFSGSYHGTFDEVVVRPGRTGHGIPGAPGILPGVYGDVRVLDYGTPETLAFIREHADDIAAVLVEPVQSRRPDFQPVDFLKAVREITAQSGACLIFDEVITGFRSHLGGAQALFGIRADLASYGKVIGGGFPIGVIAGTRDYMDALDGGAWQYGDESIPTVGVTYFAGTFVRHPLALAAAKASLEHLKQQGPALQAELTRATTAMAAELNQFCREVGAPIEIRHFASLWRVTWLEDHPLQDLLFAMMRSRGVHILDNFPCFLTTAHTSDDLARITAAFRDSVAELQEADFLPRRAASVTLADASQPPTPDARLGRDKDGKPAWFVPDATRPGKYRKLASLVTH